MSTVTIDTKDYETYADADEADDYLTADFSATVWRAEADQDSKERALVTATRILNRMSWLGEKEDPDQLLAFPRTGMGLSDIDDDEIPQGIIDASIVLAKLIHAGSPVDSTASTEQSIKRQKAGSVEIEYFRSFEDPTRLPIEVWELISRFLAGASYLGGSIASGTDGCDAFSPGYRPSGPL